MTRIGRLLRSKRWGPRGLLPPVLPLLAAIALACAVTPWGVLAAEGGAEGSGEPAGRRTPGFFYATTAPHGFFRMRLGSDVWTERYFYEEEGPDGAEISFEAEDFRDWSNSVLLTYGFTDRWEIGFLLPLVQGRLERDPLDDLSGLPPRFTDTGLGNILLVVANGHSWNDESDNLLVELLFGFPTDSRDPWFAGGAEGRLAVTAEHWWDRFGISGTLAGNFFAEEDYSNWESTFEYWLGFGVGFSERISFSFSAGEEDDVLRAEIYGEFIVSSRISVDFYVGGDLEGPADARYYGVSFNTWLGEGKR